MTQVSFMFNVLEEHLTSWRQKMKLISHTPSRIFISNKEVINLNCAPQVEKNPKELLKKLLKYIRYTVINSIPYSGIISTFPSKNSQI